MYSMVAEMNASIIRVEGMKAANSQHPGDQPHMEDEFIESAEHIAMVASELNKLPFL